MNDSNPFLVESVEQLHGYQENLFPALSEVKHVKHPQRLPLPKIRNAGDLISDEKVVEPPELIHGVLHQGLKGMIASSSKAGKTWLLLDLALSVANGVPWLKWNTTRGKVLVINFEVPEVFLKKRLVELRKHKAAIETKDLDILTLRGYNAPYDEIIPLIIRQIREQKYALVIWDPIYKGLAGKDESRAGDIAELCNQLEAIAVETGAAIVYAHHFSKGNQANKSALDRMSGSGVFARDADCIITLTSQKEDNCYTVDLTLRNLPAQKQFVVEWRHPLMVVREELDPKQLEKKGGKGEKFKPLETLAILEKEPLAYTQWEKLAMETLKMSDSTFKRHMEKLEEQGRIEKEPGTDKWRAKVQNPTSEPNEPPEKKQDYSKGS